MEFRPLHSSSDIYSGATNSKPSSHTLSFQHNYTHYETSDSSDNDLFNSGNLSEAESEFLEETIDGTKQTSLCAITGSTISA
ncbi:hypothetical protein CPC16_010111 [Podila verticillata]|nr:hypothetical protein CPC16_010111 [Podila verticillata]